MHRALVAAAGSRQLGIYTHELRVCGPALPLCTVNTNHRRLCCHGPLANKHQNTEFQDLMHQLPFGGAAWP